MINLDKDKSVKRFILNSQSHFRRTQEKFFFVGITLCFDCTCTCKRIYIMEREWLVLQCGCVLIEVVSKDTQLFLGPCTTKLLWGIFYIKRHVIPQALFGNESGQRVTSLWGRPMLCIENRPRR